MRVKLLCVLLLCFQNSFLFAAETAEDLIRRSIQSTFPDIEITSIKASKLEGLYEVLMGPELIYVSGDGRYILQGDLIDIRQRRNLTEEQRASARQSILENIPASEYIEFSPAKPKHTVYVFTDIDCGYCRKLHKDMPELNRKGIAVRYLAFPRAGLSSGTYNQMRAVWCATDQRKAMNEAKQGMKVSDKTCKDPIAEQYALGQDMGVRGTPALYSEQGQSISGYMPPDKLLQALDTQ